ncbi:hypothetical protein [Stakelama tenebrarum]|uniref:DUF4440 domain-containing protein n=1 Tax=Stakelama tenebrarum TaxID=2711215 RepID=A0A6G6Y0E6_9SPHN|nr:hypothetical protein [Sphingosinithalassobacter tenebrarum]QIG78392.1 hypothetical protein G5C33_00335 [Sphingosinithalassobacter tenebrarum]
MLIATLALLSAAPAEAAPAPQPETFATVRAEDPERLAEAFFSAWSSSGTDAALEIVNNGFAAVAGAGAPAERFRPNMEAAVRAYGKVQKWEKIKSEPLGTLLRRDTYLVQHAHFVTIWKFVFGNTDEGWVIQYWEFSDQFGENWVAL